MADKLATERLYWNADRTELVSEGDPDAAFLAAGVGQPVPDAPTKAKSKRGRKPADKAVKAPDGDK